MRKKAATKSISDWLMMSLLAADLCSDLLLNITMRANKLRAIPKPPITVNTALHKYGL